MVGKMIGGQICEVNGGHYPSPAGLQHLDAFLLGLSSIEYGIQNGLEAMLMVASFDLLAVLLVIRLDSQAVSIDWSRPQILQTRLQRPSHPRLRPFGSCFECYSFLAVSPLLFFLLCTVVMVSSASCFTSPGRLLFLPRLTSRSPHEGHRSFPLLRCSSSPEFLLTATLLSPVAFITVIATGRLWSVSFQCRPSCGFRLCRTLLPPQSAIRLGSRLAIRCS